MDFLAAVFETIFEALGASDSLEGFLIMLSIIAAVVLIVLAGVYLL